MTLLRLALATGVLLLPGAVVARALGLRGASVTLAWSLDDPVRSARGDVRGRRFARA